MTIYPARQNTFLLYMYDKHELHEVGSDDDCAKAGPICGRDHIDV
jgi:hypothetical protein